MTNIKHHEVKLQTIHEQLRFFNDNNLKARIYHGSTNSTRAFQTDRQTSVDVSHLNSIIKINEEQQYALVEPNVPMDVLVNETLKYGLLPPVVPEFPGITVGGGVQGGAEESSSFKHGLLHSCCLEYEIILGNGKTLVASPVKNSDLFYGTACSYGSLGVITLIKLKLIPAKKFVNLTYHKVSSFEEALKQLKLLAATDIDFLDCIMFSRCYGVIMSGKLSDDERSAAVTFSKATDEWFYIHVRKVGKRSPKYTETIPVKEYLFRYDRGTFWTGHLGFKIIKVPFNRLTRYLLDKACRTRTSYRFLHETNLSQRYMFQDFNISLENSLEFLVEVDRRLQIYPLWLCPLKPDNQHKLTANYTTSNNLVINIGVWGEIGKDFSRFLHLNKKFENLATKLAGRKMLYAHAYYSKKDFWQIYDHKWYEGLRLKYKASKVFPDIYDKTHVSDKYNPGVLKGFWRVVGPFNASRKSS
ncbi:MAG: FAD-binding oxidoreductase [Patescibacteria group bacterium]